MHRFQEAEIGCRPYFTPIHLQPFYRAEFGFKEGDFPVTEFAAGHASIAIPSRNHPRPPHRRGGRLRRRCPQARAGGWRRCSRRTPTLQATLRELSLCARGLALDGRRGTQPRFVS
ncbi:MAG: DegT/DnrJ/EryC1/StrS family aminotransferase [Bacillota bacterium]